MSAADLVSAWQHSVSSAADHCTPFPAGWMNQLSPDLAEQLKGIAAMCEEAHKILTDSAALLGDIVRERA